ncbi:hypothetical protein GGTG_07148 [Gaeumannomyces tritici R3-111a-1]|uniref:Methyltransferase domain-containing protein n=1 Tax=Gaeumannomyces tritici (strain R3-111a-1) TaxID=644352 RepID=J3P0V2_GAET3|nr:hypothetical protein GGTG_07148 [Gaeumannomyces tritici R3-111a-1]EJT77236.1 hypothetical protein GGTG_07148 [Gaeumannomyces tritici R3-111a-1]
MENGRAYHAFKAGCKYPCARARTERSYILPNDELYICPAGKGSHQIHRCLDAGCGTGIWAMDFADEHPEAHVIGVDLSPIQPSFVPPNVTFYVDDLEAEWTYNQPFDFVYTRMMSASIADWPKLFGQVFENLSPGGWIELLDPVSPIYCDDGTLPKDSAIYRWSNLLAEAAAKLGSRLDSGLTYKDQLLDAGFTNVVQTTYKWPINAWPKDPKHKELGAWSYENTMQALQAISLALFTRALNWTVDELELFLVEVRKDLRN